MMKTLGFVLVLAIAGCGTKSQTPVSNAGGGSADPPGPVKDTRTELERRRDGACETLGPILTTCAFASLKSEYEAGRVSKKDFEESGKPEVRAKHTSEFVKDCQAKEFSSRQVRVLEVCQKEETECEPLVTCLDNLNKQ